jgi:hypothetical protein
VRESSPSTTSFKNFGSSMVRSWNTMINSMTTSWRGRPGLLQQFQRSSFESYKPYTNENTPVASPPVMSPHASSMGGVPPAHSQQLPWGVVRGRGVGGSGGAYSGTSSSDGLDSGGESSVGDGLGMGVAAGPAAASSMGSTLAGSAGGVDGSTAGGSAAVSSFSGGSSRRWSGSSGGGPSDGGVGGAARGADSSSSGDFSGRRLRIPGKAAGRGSRGGGVAAVMAGGVPPTHQTISELHSMPLHVSTMS